MRSIRDVGMMSEPEFEGRELLLGDLHEILNRIAVKVLDNVHLSAQVPPGQLARLTTNLGFCSCFIIYMYLLYTSSRNSADRFSLCHSRVHAHGAAGGFFCEFLRSAKASMSIVTYLVNKLL